MDGGKEKTMVKLNWTTIQARDLSLIPHRSGIYLLSVICPDKKLRVVYVGKSNDLSRRMRDHWSSNESNRDLRTAIAEYGSYFSISYAEANESQLDGIESYLYDRFKPQLNEQEPQAQPTFVTPPEKLLKGTVGF